MSPQEPPQITSTRQALEALQVQVHEITALVDANKATLNRIAEYASSGSIEDGKILPEREAALRKLQDVLTKQRVSLAQLEDSLFTLAAEDDVVSSGTTLH